jgi:hypothetical protein
VDVRESKTVDGVVSVWNATSLNSQILGLFHLSQGLELQMLLSTKQTSRNEVTLVVPSFVDVRIPPFFDHHTPCLVFG